MNIKDAANILATVLAAASVAAPEPFGALMRVAAAGITAGARAIDDGATEAEVVARIHRVRHIDP